jgi:cytochrome c oxidase subunit II
LPSTPFRVRRLLSGPLPVLVAGVVALLAAGCTTVNAPGGDPSFFPPTAVTDQGRGTAELYSIIFWIAAGVFFLVEGLLIWSVLRYRRRRGDDTLPAQTHGNMFFEVLWTAVPAAVVLVLFVLTMTTLARVEAKAPRPDVTVDAYGFQWQWAFGYDCPQEFDQTFTKIADCGLSFTGLGTEGPTMVLPIQETVRIRLHSADVNHAFYVPQFLYKKDVVPGQVNSFDVRIEEAGTYPGQCAEFCGLAHASMIFTVRAVDRAEYDTWKQQAEQEAQQSPSPAPASSGEPGGSPGASPGDQATALQLSASNAQAFDTDALEAPAQKAFAVQFTNNDTTAPHNFAIKSATPEGDFTGQPIAQPGGGQETYQVPLLAPGEYQFYCSVHPNMTGTLTVR